VLTLSEYKQQSFKNQGVSEKNRASFIFDFWMDGCYKTTNQVLTGLVPHHSWVRLKGKRVQLPRCPATVREYRLRKNATGDTWEGAKKG
jgi:hypothetical protein